MLLLLSFEDEMDSRGVNESESASGSDGVEA